MGYDDYASDQIIAELEVERDTARAEREAAQRKIESQKRLIRARELESERLREARAVSLPDDAEMERVFRDKIAIALSHNRRDMSKDAIEYFGDVVFIESLKDAVRTLLAPRPEQSAAEPVDTKLVTSLLGWAENVRTLANHAIAGDNPKEAAYALAEAMTRAANVLANPAPATPAAEPVEIWYAACDEHGPHPMTVDCPDCLARSRPAPAASTEPPCPACNGSGEELDLGSGHFVPCDSCGSSDNWLAREAKRAKERTAQLPPQARPIVTRPPGVRAEQLDPEPGEEWESKQ
jgi:hypothetical protein